MEHNFVHALAQGASLVVSLVALAVAARLNTSAKYSPARIIGWCCSGTAQPAVRVVDRSGPFIAVATPTSAWRSSTLLVN